MVIMYRFFPCLRRHAHGFTLVEMLVVISIIGVLIAIVAPTFLGPTHNAQDSAAQDSLTLAWRAAFQSATDNDNHYAADMTKPSGCSAPYVACRVSPILADLEQVLGPDLDITSGGCNDSTGPTNVVIDPLSTSADNLILYVKSASGTIWELSAPVLEPKSIFSTDCAHNGVLTNIAIPTIFGTAASGQTLAVSPGAWSGGPTSYSYQWQRCDGNGDNCSDISGAINFQYTVSSDDTGQTLQATITAHNTGSTASISTNPTRVVTGLPPTNQSPPSISGQYIVGHDLTADHGTWTGTSPISYSYQWQRCDSDGANCTDIVANVPPLTAGVSMSFIATFRANILAMPSSP